jgi:hypothetical protein
MAVGSLISKFIWIINTITNTLCGESSLPDMAAKVVEADNNLGRTAALLQQTPIIPSYVKVRACLCSELRMPGTVRHPDRCILTLVVLGTYL